MTIEKMNCLIDLHLHLDGAISLESAKQLAKMQGIEIPTSDEELLKKMRVSKDCSDLNEFLEMFEFPCSLLQTNEYKFSLPPFCHFTSEEWQEKGHEYDEVRDNMLGWDITDYGTGKFDECGFSLITIRNGNLAMKDKYPKTYAEKLLYIKEGQNSPMHFHWNKMEDIINRGGGTVLIQVFNSLSDEEIDRVNPVHVHLDGREIVVEAGTQVELKPGDSITIYPYMYHDFNVKPGTGPVLLGEVSQTNDDNTDNRFYAPIGRFPEIEEDEKPYRLLCNEYPKAK